MSFDRNKVKVDGKLNDWEEGTQLYKTSPSSSTDFAVDYDEKYVYMKLKSDEIKTASPRILLDVVPEQGNTSATTIKNITFSNGVDFIVELNKNSDSRVVIDEYYDFYDYFYGHLLSMIPPRMKAAVKNSGKFAPIYYVLNKQLYLPEQKKTTDFSFYETGKLLQGNANPEASNYNSLVDYTWTDDNVIELRIPWLLLQSKDPSQREFMGDLYANGETASVKVDNIFVGVVFVDEEGKVVQSLPKSTNNVLPALDSYSWDTWQQPKYNERLKQSYYILQKVFKDD
ncbi:Glycosyl transferase family 2 OS=Lysinibacillus sphaericus OX=1421 GN=LS41612_05160 PE=4 SV=1 [Lysinibacillus sphaericus]